MDTKQEMHLLGLDDRIAAVDLSDIALDQLGTIVKEIPPEKWGDAAKKLPTDFVKSICKQGAFQEAQTFASEYGVSIGVGIAASLGVGYMTNNPLVGLVAGLALGYGTYYVTHQLTNA